MNPQNKSIQTKRKQKFQGEDGLCKQIIALELESEKTLEVIEDIKMQQKKLNNKILVNSVATLISQKEKLESELINANKVTQTKKKELNKWKREETTEEKYKTILNIEAEMKHKQLVIFNLKKEVKELELLNRNVDRKIFTKSQDNNTSNLIKGILLENRYLKGKISEIQLREERSKNRIKTQIDDTGKTKSRLATLPEINQSRRSLKVTRKTSSKQTSLEKSKVVYTKWIGNRKNLENQKIDIELDSLEKQHNKLNSKIHLKNTEIDQLRNQIESVKKSLPESPQKKRSFVFEKEVKYKDWTGGYNPKIRSIRKDWIGRFDCLRFSDTRYIREECRLFGITHNDQGYYKFSYYSVRTGKIYESKPPFNLVVAPNGQQRVFEVVWPDYITTLAVLIDPSLGRIIGLCVKSVSGVQHQFIDGMYEDRRKIKKKDKNIIEYKFDIGSNEAPMCIFGSYYIHYDSNGKMTDVFLQGLGVDITEQLVMPR